MNVVFAYSLVASAILLLLYPAVRFAVGKNNNFKFNRMLLLSALLVSLMAPAVMTFGTLTHKPLAENISVESGEMLQTVTSVADLHEQASPTIPILIGVYHCGVIFLTLKAVYSLFAVLKLKRRCRKDSYDNHALYIHTDNRISPFSFGRAMFILETDRVDAIVRHESGHVNANHWIDIMLAELSCIFMWYNPFIWLYKSLIKLNHEYEADSFVISGGIEVSNYQHLLIDKALGRRTMPLADSFSTHGRSFRRRVLVMNEGKTSTAKKLFGLLLLPSMAVAVIFINQPLSANVLLKIKDFHVIQKEEFNESPKIGPTQNAVLTEPSPTLLPSPIVDPAPLAKTVEYAIKYDSKPAPIKANVRLTIDDKGRIIDTEIDGDYSPALKIAINEAISDLSFEPALDNGKPVQIKIVLPIRRE